MCDAERESNIEDRRPTFGSTILRPNLISWWFCKQHIIARSSTEAEYCNLAQSSEILCIQALLKELSFSFSTLVMLCHN